MNEEEKKVIEDMNPEEGIPGAEQPHPNAAALGDTIREYVRKGNVSKIVIKRGNDVLVNLPLTAGIVGGIIGAVAAPWALVTAAVATAGFDCNVEIVKVDGEVVTLDLRKLGRKVVDTGTTVVGEIREAVGGIRNGADGAEAPVDEEIPFEDAENKE